ncbi:hypothetical protein M422DRAFT_31105 [Sphaerobolus stellatus SS14]|uniref:Plus3 domain-containing protein n=1 Tax=Sphaerobolus stellatus (strain SS14) TaxID=990650 RepID=A0A0C9U853_SPHS4|nr:hypothetical protein M422DRAFT_32843 [Sphaerobolus stellatus SS14]KIJ43001.1 hypothetical protein M422DRAFT_31105 [Sphaerobolus stellatus SS14]
MSDGEEWEDELLALATQDDSKKKASKKRRSSSSGKEPSSKRRKADMNVESDSDMEPESEEDDSNPYPLDGKYKNEGDRSWLMGLPELEREDILARRMEELQERYESQNLDSLIKAQNGKSGGDAVAHAAKRKHTARGSTKEKSRKLDELKARRKAKEDRARNRTEKADSPTDRRRSSSSEPELSDVTDEDGEINKDEEEDGKYRDKFESRPSDKTDLKPSYDDFQKLRVSRHQISKYYYNPWFENWITGSWVRYLIGADETTRQPIYRICEVLGVVSNPVKAYKVNDIVVDRLLELKHGDAVRSFPMDKISDSPFSQKEYERIIRVMEDEKVEFPSRRSIQRKVEQLRELPRRPLTEADITAMIARKNALNPSSVAASQMFNTRVDLTQKKNLAVKRHDYKEAAAIDKELQELAAAHPDQRKEQAKDTQAELLARVNERNRKANLEQIRKAEAEATIRKRQERRAIAAAAAAGLAPPAPSDVSARVPTVAKTHHQSLSRVNTPLGTPKLGDSDSAGNRSISPLPPLNDIEKANTRPANGTLEAKIIDSIQIDLGDF